MTLRMSEKRTFGAASRSSPSLRWNSSRYSSGTSPTSRNDSTWPSFIAAPFIVAERGDDLLGGLDVAALERLLLPLVAAGEVGGRGAELARGLARREAGHPSRARDA